MNEPSTPAAAPLAPPNRVRDRVRLLALLVLVGIWMGPGWVEAEVGDEIRWEKGAVRTGISAALAVIALWGLAATSLASATLRGLRIGAALTDAGIALTTTALLAATHPWIPGGELREAWVPIFGPLALLALLDALVIWKRADAGFEVSVVRAGAALFAAGALVASGDWIPAGIAAWLGIAPLMFLKLRTAPQARRSLEAFVLVAAVVAGLAPWIQPNFVGSNPVIGATLRWPQYVWCVTAALVVTTALDGLMRPVDDTRAAA